MIGVSLLLFPLALFDAALHASPGWQRVNAPRGEPAVSRSLEGQSAGVTTRHTGGSALDWLPLGLGEAFRASPARQVRIEHRVVIRIVPLGRTARPNGLTNAGSSIPIRLVERPIAGCIPVRNIAGVSADGAGRLRLHMHGRQVVTLRFRDECRADAFYSGFYVERSRDGLMCPARDALHSRSGVRCTVGRFHQLVAVRAQ